MSAYRCAPPPVSRIVWRKPAVETGVAVALSAGLAALSCAAAFLAIGAGAWSGGIIGAAAAVLLGAVSVRFVDRDVVTIDVDGTTISARGLLSRRVRARARFVATTEVEVAERLVIAVQASGGESPTWSPAIGREYEVTVRTDDESTSLVTTRWRATADDVAAWIAARRS
ncbi:MAG: hypothetical protein HYV09_34660 [Deltaproteobacteria bacterium]|nr:hypothetical protein [Deltaproteobacteria bacterium]